MTALKNELRQEREQILQQMGKQRVELEREIEKAKTEENYVRDRLALSLKVAFLLALQPASALGTHTVLLRSKSPSQTQGSSLPWPGRGGGFASRGPTVWCELSAPPFSSFCRRIPNTAGRVNCPFPLHPLSCCHCRLCSTVVAVVPPYLPPVARIVPRAQWQYVTWYPEQRRGFGMQGLLLSVQHLSVALL